jgi:hypothetical protein
LTSSDGSIDLNPELQKYLAQRDDWKEIQARLRKVKKEK